MKFLIITHVPHIKSAHFFYGYRPYVDEMNLWIKNVSSLIVVAPVSNEIISDIQTPYNRVLDFRNVSSFNFIGWKSKFNALILLPQTIVTIVAAMKNADHIHLRCPGNIGLLGCIVQVFFPKKPKTAKYAGNWDPKSKQPWSYRLQKWILSNTFLTRNMQVLVYGEWSHQSKNIKPFFTATYTESEKQPLLERNWDTIELLFAGTLTPGKRPLYAVQLAERLHNDGYHVRLRIYGEGIERQFLTDYIDKQKLDSVVYMMGNKSKSELKEAYAQSHFLILPSRSEGWPKAIAEAMFWGCIPVSTAVSCIPYMLENGKRGILLSDHLPTDAAQLATLIQNKAAFQQLSLKAAAWSRTYTIDRFEAEILKLLES